MGSGIFIDFKIILPPIYFLNVLVMIYLKKFVI